MSRRNHLRIATREAHEQLDAMVGSLDSRAAYRSYLAGIAGFRLPVEHRITEAGNPYATDLIGAEIGLDLAHMDVTPPLSGEFELPRGESAMLGLLYVIEGSALGARLLVRYAEAIGLDEASGAAHLFRQAGNLSGWKSFVEALESAEDYDARSALDSALSTFAFARRAFALAQEGRMNAS